MKTQKRVTRSAQKQTYQTKSPQQIKFEISNVIEKFYKTRDKKLKELKDRVNKEKNQILEEVEKEAKTKSHLKKRKHSEQEHLQDKVKSTWNQNYKYRTHQVVIFSKQKNKREQEISEVYLTTYEFEEKIKPFLHVSHEKLRQLTHSPKMTPRQRNLAAILSDSCKSQTLSLKTNKKEKVTKKRRRKVVDEDFSSAGKDSSKKGSALKSRMSLPLKKPRANTNLEKFSYTKAQAQKKGQKASNSNSLSKKSNQSKENQIFNQQDTNLSGIQMNNKFNINKQALNQTIISMEIDSGDENSPNAETKSNPQGGGQKASKELPKEIKNKDINDKTDKEADQGGEKKKNKVEWGYKLGFMSDKELICSLPYKTGERIQKVEIFYCDFEKLEPTIYLNDTIILFFIKFLENYVLEEEQQKQVHFFNSFFMQKITCNFKPKTSNFFNPVVPTDDIAELINYKGVVRWTKNVDLFSKRFLLVPICDSEHWSLAIFCEPARIKKVITEHIQKCIEMKKNEKEISSNPSIQKNQMCLTKSSKKCSQSSSSSTTKNRRKLKEHLKRKRERYALPDSPILYKSSSDDEDDDEDSLNSNGLEMEDENSFQEYFHFQNQIPLPDSAPEDQAYILYMDSMNQAQEYSMKALRNYICLEYLEKKVFNTQPEYREFFTKKYGWPELTVGNVPHYQPKVPKQKNTVDCGLYLLEFAEAFLQDPEFVLGNLNQDGVKLFRSRCVYQKREVIKRVILAIAKKEMGVETIGGQYRKWRNKMLGKDTHYQSKKQGSTMGLNNLQ